MIKRYHMFDESKRGDDVVCGMVHNLHGDYVLYSDILPILKAARDVAGALIICHALEYGCEFGKCGACEAARKIIEQTEGI